MMYLEKTDFLEVVKNSPVSAIDIIVRDKTNKILVGLRKNSPAKGYWFVPGGRIFKDETIAHAFSRICENEIGLHFNIKQAKFIGVFEHHYNDNFANSDFSTHYITQAYEVKVDVVDEKIFSSQHDDIAWYSDEEIQENINVHQYTKNYIF